MKLESIKNEKFVMTNNEMGKLVGGAVQCETTPNGTYKGSSYSADTVTTYTGSDIKDGVVKHTLFYRGDCDTVDATNNCEWINRDNVKCMKLSLPLL